MVADWKFFLYFFNVLKSSYSQLQLCIKNQTQCNLAEPGMLVTMLSDVTNSVVGFIDLWGKRI